MPGIVGMISQKPAEECRRVVQSMVDSLGYEPFYESGFYSVPGLSLHAGWVAHEGSFAAGQVFLNEDKDIALLLAGECFTDAETRVGLKRNGHHLDGTAGDWLVHLYEEEGGRFFAKL